MLRPRFTKPKPSTNSNKLNTNCRLPIHSGDWQSLQLSSYPTRRIPLPSEISLYRKSSTRKIRPRRIAVRAREKKEVLHYETLATNWGNCGRSSPPDPYRVAATDQRKQVPAHGAIGSKRCLGKASDGGRPELVDSLGQRRRR